MSATRSAEARATVAVIGLGGIGGGAAGALAAAGRHEVVACVRRPLDRLVLERPEGAVETPLRVLGDPAAALPVDWVLVCTKTPDTPGTAPWLAGLCGPGTRVAVLQNGLDRAAAVRPLAPGAAVLSVVVYYNGERLGPDRVRLRPVGAHDLAVADDEAGRAFARLFEGTGLRVLLSDDFTTLMWRKLLLNAAVNPITALTLERQGVMRRPDIQALALAVLEEAAAVGRAGGARFAADEPARTLAQILAYAPELGTSMYFDRLAGRPLEIDALTGAVVAAGERAGVPTPLNRALYALLGAASDAARERRGEGPIV